MTLEDLSPIKEEPPVVKMEVEENFKSFVPSEFRVNPIKYFEERSTNIKSGDVVYDESGEIKEDPTAVKDFPRWVDSEGKELQVVGKKVNTLKSQIGKTGDPFHEYAVMEIAQEFDLPAPRPVLKLEQGNNHLIVMTKVEGLRWIDRDAELVRKSGLTPEEIQSLLREAEKMMEELKKKFERIGLRRTWALKDMIFDVDLENRRVNSITPTDWERTKIDKEKLAQARKDASH